MTDNLDWLALLDKHGFTTLFAIFGCFILWRIINFLMDWWKDCTKNFLAGYLQHQATIAESLKTLADKSTQHTAISRHIHKDVKELHERLAALKCHAPASPPPG